MMKGMELMVKKIMRDPLFLAQKSVDATEADWQVVIDLLDTLRANLEHCVGMAADMIGVKKKQHGKYSGWTAQIIQHEIDHCNGIVI